MAGVTKHASSAPPGPPDVPEGLAFPGAARLELDELLDQVIARAGELKTVQGRLRKLLAATHHVAQRLDTQELLGRVVESARSLVDARHAALVLGNGTVVRSGLSDAQVAALGRLATPDGPLDPLLAQARPVRLAALVEEPPGDDGLAGTSFLGVPLRVGGAVHGHLYLLDKQGAPQFGRDDEELVSTLAGAAGVAVENALLLEAAHRRARWESAAAELGRRLLAGTPDAEGGLRHLLEEALELGEAQGAVLSGVEDDDPATLVVLSAAGDLAALEGRRLALRDTITAAALGSERAVVLSTAARDRRAGQLTELAPATGSALAMRLAGEIAGERIHAVLTLVRHAGREPFDDGDVDMIESLAAQASVTFALARSRADREALRRVEDRELLVADLNTRVLQRLLRVGTALTSAGSVAGGTTRDRVLAQVDELDALVRELRRAVWSGPGPERKGSDDASVAVGEVPPARSP
jgi:GAF domain-containing protein